MGMFNHDKPGQLIWTGGQQSTALQLARIQRMMNDIYARHVNVQSLGEMAPDLGVVTSGLFWSGTGLPGDGDESGIGISGEGAVYNTETWNLFGVNAGTLQAGIKATDGKMYAGAGAVKLDAEGVTIEASDSPDDLNRLKWIATDNDYMPVNVLGYMTGTSPDRTAYAQLIARSESDSAAAYAQVIAGNFGDAVSSRLQVAALPDTDHLTFLDGYGHLHKVLRGWVDPAVQISLTTSAQAITSHTVEANSLGTKGMIETEAEFVYLNNSGANRTLSITYNFGSYSHTITTAALTAHATNRHTIRVRYKTINAQANNVQRHMIDHITTGGTAQVPGTLNGKTFNNAFDTSAVDTSADITVSETVLSSAATATQTLDGVGIMDGPYYGA